MKAGNTMKRVWLLFGAAMAASVNGCATPPSSPDPHDLSPQPLPTAETIPQDPAQRATWFIHFITALADNGGVHDQTELTSIFSAGLKVVQISHTQNTFACQSTGQPSLSSYNVIRLDDTWFHSMPGGLAHMSFPGFTINPAGETGAPMLDFTADLGKCPDDPYNGDSTALSFENLPAFACITGTALVAAAPTVKEERVTDGGIGFGYAGKVEQETSTGVQFSGRFGGPCLIAATVSRTGGHGYRMMRAQYKWSNCLRQSGGAFCKAHPEFQFSYPPDPSTLSLMDAKQRHVLAECGGFNDYYRKEPASGPIPPPLPASGYFQSNILQRVCPQQ